MKRKIENRRKRILTILMAVLLTLGMTIPVTAEGAPETVSGDSGSTPEQTWMKKSAVSVLPESVPFDDVTDRDWFYQAVCNVYNNKIMNGISDTQFEPAGQVSRGMAVADTFSPSLKPENHHKNRNREKRLNGLPGSSSALQRKILSVSFVLIQNKSCGAKVIARPRQVYPVNTRHAP